MNKSNLKRYAPQARKDFIAAVTARAQLLGLSLAGARGSSSADGAPVLATGPIGAQQFIVAEPVQRYGDVTQIAGRAWPAQVQGQRDNLLARMQRDGYSATLEAIAYTWFNRLAALRYMELHDYLGHGRRVLSNAEGGLPEVLAHALDLAEAGDLPGLRADTVRDLKLANQDGELYRRVLLAQCNALHTAMPFLFEALDDETELLLPDNLLLSDSIVAKLVAEIPEEDWTEVEAIGWLYQFYISEKKDEVIGKVVKSEDIPAATQLFTPNWIVQYLVQNSVGRLWLMANPSSTLASQWPYYIEPAKQTDEVQAQLDALIQTRIREDGEALNPETITVLDPACGSGHILVVAYDVLKAIYLERGYQPRAIPRLILEKNLYGLDIDDRAAQLAAFALLMKARADDRRLFNDPPKLNVLSLQESKGLDADELATHLAPFGLQRAALKSLLDTFEHAKTFGSLIQIPAGLNGQLAAMTAGLQQALQDGDMYARQAAKDVVPLVWQALMLGMQFDVVVANPPYMGAKTFNAKLKSWLRANYAGFDRDLFAPFIFRNLQFAKSTGMSGAMTSFAWMFNSSFEQLRKVIVQTHTIDSLIQLHYDAFEAAKAHVCTFMLLKANFDVFQSVFIRLAEFPGADIQSTKTLEAIKNRACGWLFETTASGFLRIPGTPLAYWISAKLRKAFDKGVPLKKVAEPNQGLSTADTNRFLRRWAEVSLTDIKFSIRTPAEAKKSNARWFPHSKGGEFRRWYGNNDWIIDWRNDGESVRAFPNAAVRNSGSYFLGGVTWSDLTSSLFNARSVDVGFVFDTAGPTAVLKKREYRALLHAYMNSAVFQRIIGISLPGLHYNNGTVGVTPVILDAEGLSDIEVSEAELVKLSKLDWDSFERSWEYQGNPLVRCSNEYMSLDSCYTTWISRNREAVQRLKFLEEANNRLFIRAFDLESELSTEVPTEYISLTANPAYRYSGKHTEQEQWARFRRDSSEELVSYAIGCMMGRYSLDEPGLIYAHAGNVGFDPSRYEKKFPADADGIVPITDERWFKDDNDAASRVREFLRAVWGADKLEENMAWLAESLGTKGSETPDETIRRYLADKFFKDHLQTYKKRPIYWLFSSGKQGAFQALVYLHRYHEGTLARLRAEYVLPLTGKMQARMESLQADIRAASSTAARTKLTKQLEKAKKQHLELLAYDEKLRHYADQRIALDLDDGVKVNYGKFGDLLAEVKAVTGGVGDD